MSFPFSGTRGWGLLTQDADTKIVRLVTPRKNLYTHLLAATIKVGTTAHTLTVLRPLGKTTFSADAAASQAVVNITANPGDYTGVRTADNSLAGSDRVVYRAADGTYVADTVSSISSLAVTLSTNLPTGGVTRGDPIWHFGIETDTNPNDALAHPQFTLAASTTVILGATPGETVCGFCGSFDGPVCSGKEAPLLLIINNATAASVLENVVAGYSSLG
jgi:hypothetical protein